MSSKVDGLRTVTRLLLQGYNAATASPVNFLISDISAHTHRGFVRIMTCTQFYHLALALALPAENLKQEPLSKCWRADIQWRGLEVDDIDQHLKNPSLVEGLPRDR